MFAQDRPQDKTTILMRQRFFLASKSPNYIFFSLVIFLSGFVSPRLPRPPLLRLPRQQRQPEGLLLRLRHQRQPPSQRRRRRLLLLPERILPPPARSQGGGGGRRRGGPRRGHREVRQGAQGKVRRIGEREMPRAFPHAVQKYRDNLYETLGYVKCDLFLYYDHYTIVLCTFAQKKERMSCSQFSCTYFETKKPCISPPDLAPTPSRPPCPW